MESDRNLLGIRENDWTTLDEINLGQDREARGRGELLSERPYGLQCHEEKSIRRRPLLMVIFFASAASLAILPFIVPVDGEDFSAFMFVTFYVSIVGTVTLMLAMFLVRQNRIAERVYENGVEVSEPRGGTMYYPWGFFTTASELDNSKGRRLILACARRWVVIPSGMPRYDDWMRDVEKRVGREEYMDPGPKGARERIDELERYIRSAVGSVILASVVIAVVVYFGLLHDEGSFEPLMFAIIVLLVVMTALPVIVAPLLKQRTVRFYGHDLRRVLALYVILLVVLYSVFTVGLVVTIDSDEAVADLIVTPTPEPSSSTLVPGLYEGQSIVSDGSIKVNAGENLTLVNCTVTFDPARALDGGIWVGEGGSLVVVNSTLTSADIFKGFSIKLHGSASFTTTEIIGICDLEEHFDTDVDHWMYEYGFEVAGDAFTMKDCVVRDSTGSGLILNGCNATLEGCTFFRSPASGLVIHRADPEVRNCTFEGCERGLNLYYSNASIANCTFRSDTNGVELRHSSPTISDCVFNDCYENAILSLGSEPRLVDNQFVNNGNDVLDEQVDYLEFDDTWFILSMVYMVPVMLLIMSSAEVIGERFKLKSQRRKDALE